MIFLKIYKIAFKKSLKLKNSNVSLEKTLTNKLTLMWQNIENIHTIFTIYGIFTQIVFKIRPDASFKF